MNGDLPEGWANASLGEVCSKPQYGWTSRATKNGRVKYLRTTDISGGDIDWATVPFCEKVPDDIEKYRVHVNDILVSRAGSVGLSQRIKDVPSDVVFASYLIRFNPLDGIEPKFIEAFLKSRGYWEEISDFTAGIAIPNVNASKLASLELPLAPSCEQKRIATRLEALFAKVDACKERLSKASALLKRFRQSVLAAACSGRLTEDWRHTDPARDTPPLLKQISAKRADWIDQQIAQGNREARRLRSKLADHHYEEPSIELPSDWTWGSFLHACWLVVDCHNKTAPYTSKGVPLIRTTNVRNGQLLLEDVKHVSNDTYAYWSRRCPPLPGDVLFSREAPMGECAVIPEGARVCMGQRMMLLRVFPELLCPGFLSFAIQDPTFRRRLEVNAVGSGVKHLRVGDVEKLVIPIPPPPEQQEIVRRVEKLFAFADQIEARFTEAKKRADSITQSILAKAFSGELVPTEHELAKAEGRSFESAEEMLKRIKGDGQPKEKTSKRNATVPARR